jgi:hypothetical protein
MSVTAAIIFCVVVLAITMAITSAAFRSSANS